MSRQAVVGLFAIVAIALLFVIAYYLTTLGAKAGYQFAIHFDTAAGLQQNAPVMFSGLQVGTVDHVTLLPDNTVDVVVSMRQGLGIPLGSRYLIQAPVTGSPSLVIIPPRGGAQPRPTYPPQILPIAQQPRGENPVTISDLIVQGQGEIRRLDTILGLLEKQEPQLYASLQTTLANANEMTQTMRSSIENISATLQSELGSAGANIASMAQTLNSTAKLDAPKLDRMLGQMEQASVALNSSMHSVESLANDPHLKANVLATTQNIAQTTQTLKQLLGDLRGVTADPATQAHIRQTIANLDAVMQRAASLLGRFGGKSHVYGVDQGATPPPAASSPSPVASPHPLSESERAAMSGTLAELAHNLISLELRIGELDRQQVCCPSPLFSADRGPQTDINAILLPHSSTSVLFGANDIGANTTWNLAAMESVAPYARLGGGVLYSRLGVLGSLGNDTASLDARFYDPRRPALDLFGNLRLAPYASLFFGERAINLPERRTDYGIEFRY